MNEKPNTVRAVVRALEGGEALVEVESGGCGRCHEAGGCGGQQLTQMFCGGPKHYRVDNTVGAQPGDPVQIAIGAGRIRQTANLAYGLPLLALLAGAMAGFALAGEGGAIAGAGAGLLLAFLFVRRRALAQTGNPDERPHIVSRS